MLKKNVGYNVSPTKWFEQFSEIGTDGTYLTDYRSIANVLGPVRANQELSVGLFPGGEKISFFKARLLARDLGLQELDQLIDGFRFSRVSNVSKMLPRSPLRNENQNFMPAKGLPNGAPEIVVDSIQTKPWPWR
jgi:hypothetical protein